MLQCILLYYFKIFKIMDEAKAGRITGIFLADVVYYCAILGVGVLSLKTLSGLLKTVVTYEVARQTIKNKPNQETEEL